MTDNETKLLELWQKTSQGPWYAVNYGPDFLVSSDWCVECNLPDSITVAKMRPVYEHEDEEFNAKFIALAQKTVPITLARLEAMELELAEAKEWMARFAHDSEAYKQGFEDGIKEQIERNKRKEDSIW